MPSAMGGVPMGFNNNGNGNNIMASQMPSGPQTAFNSNLGNPNSSGGNVDNSGGNGAGGNGNGVAPVTTMNSNGMNTNTATATATMNVSGTVNLSGIHGAATSVDPAYLASVGGMNSLVTPVEACILYKTIESLCKDRIFPEEKTVKARLIVFGASGSLLQNFVSHYRRLPLYNVSTNENRVTSVTLKEGAYKDEFLGWVDPCSNEDPYPKKMWNGFSVYLQNLVGQIKENANTGGEPPFTFHRGRYGMAQELYSRKLDFFSELTLGEVCHVVELAIQNKLLAYENNMLLPASACCSLTNALFGRPTATSSHSNENYIKDFEEFKAILAFLLQAYPDGFNLSTLKTKIRTIFHKRLSETVFHQTKLLDLVQLSPIDQIVKIVKLQGNCGYLCQPNWSTWSQWAKPDFRESFNFRRRAVYDMKSCGKGGGKFYNNMMGGNHMAGGRPPFANQMGGNPRYHQGSRQNANNPPTGCSPQGYNNFRRANTASTRYPGSNDFLRSESNFSSNTGSFGGGNSSFEGAGTMAGGNGGGFVGYQGDYQPQPPQYNGSIQPLQ